VSLRRKLLLAQAPLAVALALVGVLSALVTTRLAGQSRLILADNYRSVLAAQRMKESLERIDSNAVYRVVGHDAGTDAAIAVNRRTFENELQVQEGNITEPGEADATRALRASWNEYAQSLEHFLRLAARAERDDSYFHRLQPTF
jgi:NtrC-family two-component system sensor histidine kinase KinB